MDVILEEIIAEEGEDVVVVVDLEEMDVVVVEDLDQEDAGAMIITDKVLNVQVKITIVLIIKVLYTQEIKILALVQEYAKASQEIKYRIVKINKPVFVTVNTVQRLKLFMQIHLNLEEIFVMRPIKYLSIILNAVMIKM